MERHPVEGQQLAQTIPGRAVHGVALRDTHKLDGWRKRHYI
jgi:hypothetical protein